MLLKILIVITSFTLAASATYSGQFVKVALFLGQPQHVPPTDPPGRNKQLLYHCSDYIHAALKRGSASGQNYALHALDQRGRLAASDGQEHHCIWLRRTSY